jgi:hypothetical protein
MKYFSLKPTRSNADLSNVHYFYEANNCSVHIQNISDCCMCLAGGKKLYHIIVTTISSNCSYM